MSTADIANLARLPAEKAVLTEYGAHLEPELRVSLGERFVVETNDNWFNSVKEAGLPETDKPPTQARQYLRVNPLAGPIYVNGVEAGDALVVDLEAIDIRDWGWTGTVPGFGPLAGTIGWEELQGPWATIIRHVPGPSGSFRDGEAVMTLDRESRWPLAPFIGTLVTAPERGIENSLIGQGPWCGNIDCREIAPGSKIFINSTHEGGLLFMGDVHGSQADSELSGMADETAAHVTLKCDVLKNKKIPGVCRVEKPDSLIQVESARNAGNIDRAVNNTFLYMIDWLRGDYGISKAEAYMHMTANSLVRSHIYQATTGFFVCGVEFPKACL